MSDAPNPGLEAPHDDDRVRDRKRDILVLMMRALSDYGFNQSYQTLAREAGFNLNQIDAADNIDLYSIVTEFSDFYHSRFGRYPRLVRPKYAEFQMEAPGAYHVHHGRSPTTAAAAAAAPLPPLLHPPTSAALATALPLALPIGLPSLAACQLPYTQQLQQLQQLQQQAHQAVVLQLQPAQVDANGAADTAANEHPMASNCYATPPPTIRRGATQACSQAEFVEVLTQLPGHLPSSLFEFNKPRYSNNKRRSAALQLNDMQEELLYALVGCAGVGWSIRNLSSETRAWLELHHGIGKDELQLFFKNRANKRQRAKAEAGLVGEGVQQQQQEQEEQQQEEQQQEDEDDAGTPE